MAGNKKNVASDRGAFSSKIILGGILFLGFLTFSNSLKNNFIFNWDDDVYVTDNPLIKDLSLQGIKNIFTTPYEGNYHPLTALVNAIEYNVFGKDSTTFHVFSLLFHLLNVCLVFYFILLLSNKIEIAAIVSALFAIHPMHVESVSWVAEQKDLLYSIFYLLSLIYYVKHLRRNKTLIENGSSPVANKYKSYFISILFFILSLLSKPMAITLPVVLILLDYYFQKTTDHKLLRVAEVLKYIPFFLLAIIFGIIAIKHQSATKALEAAGAFSIVDRFFLGTYAIVLYLFKLVAPIRQHAFYSFPEVDHLLPLEYYAAFVVILVIAFIIYRQKKFRKEIIFGFLFFLITISIVLQFIPVGGAVIAERYTYIPYIGLFFIVGKIYSEVNSRSAVRKVVLFGIVVFAILTFNRNKVWANAYTLFSDTIKKNHSYLTYFNLGFSKEILMKDYQGALADYEMSFALKKDFYVAYNNAGIVKATLQDYEAAINYFTKAVEANPKYAEAYCNRAIAKNYLKDYEGAVADCSEAIRLNPNHIKAYDNRAEAYYHLNKPNEAINDLTVAASLGDDYATNMLRELKEGRAKQ